MPTAGADAIVGDLTEEYALRLQTATVRSTNWWLWGQVCRSMPSLLSSSLRGNEALPCVGVALAVSAAAGAFKLGIDLLLTRWLMITPGAYVVAAPFVFLAAVAGAGMLTGHLRRGATIHLAGIVLATVVILLALSSCPIPVPWWYPAPFLTLGPLAALAAPAVLEVCHSRSRR